MDLDFIAGLIDSDGSLLLSLERSKKSKTGYRRKLILDITNKDKTVLLLIKETLGFGMVVSVSNTLYAYRTNTYKNAEKIISLFENRVYGSAKVEMPLWKNAWILVKTKEIDSLQSFTYFVHLMYGINEKGRLRKHPIDYWLKVFKGQYLPNYVEKIKDQYKNISLRNITGAYISGYCQGDGSFNLSNKKRFIATFTLTDAYKPILVLIQNFLIPKKKNNNCIFEIDPKTSENNKMCFRFQITRFNLCRVYIIYHFDKFPVYGIQLKRYTLWRQAVLLQDKKSQYSLYSLSEYKNQISEICTKLKNLKEK